MPGLGTVGSIVAAVVMGGGLLWFAIRRIRASYVEEQKRATQENWNISKLEGEAQERDAKDSMDRAMRDAGRDPLDW